MTTELEKKLIRELGEIADGVNVPAMPALPTEETGPRTAHLWVPLLAAAAVLAIVGGIAALVFGQQAPVVPQPAPAPSITPTQDPSREEGAAFDEAPTVSYVLNQNLYVDGTQMPGNWASVDSRRDVWLALRTDGSWWWGGPGVDAGRIDAQIDQPPVLSPDGGYIAFIDTADGRGRPTGFDTQPAGEGLGQAPFDVPATEDGVAPRVRAVTDEGDIIVQGTQTSVMWRATFQDQRTVIDLNETAPDQAILDNTTDGLIVVDGTNGAVDATSTAPYLASISPEGELTSTGTLPTYDDLTVSPESTWLVYSPAGTLGGEVASVESLRTQRGNREAELNAPVGFGFAVGTWTWEDDAALVTVLLPDGATDQDGARMGRCIVAANSCRVIAGPDQAATDPATDGATGATTSGAQESYTAEEALDSVVQAVANDDRPSLIDQSVITDSEWDQLVSFADGQGGAAAGCREFEDGRQDCEIVLETSPESVFYAILESAENAYGWRVTYVSISEA